MLPMIHPFCGVPDTLTVKGNTFCLTSLISTTRLFGEASALHSLLYRFTETLIGIRLLICISCMSATALKSEDVSFSSISRFAVTFTLTFSVPSKI